MTSSEIWTEVYERGHKSSADTLSFELKKLWYYIDFTYYVDNGGATGFLHNMSPSEDQCADYFQPYIETWKFFGFTELAHVAEEYNDRYLKAVKEYNKNGKRDFEEHKRKLKIEELVNVLDPIITRIVWTDKNKMVWNWLDENNDRLQKLLQT
jgi:hypothetical protein